MSTLTLLPVMVSIVFRGTVIPRVRAPVAAAVLLPCECDKLQRKDSGNSGRETKTVATDVSRTTVISGAAAPREKGTGGRLVSLDAYRGFIMLLLVSEGFGFSVLRNYPDWAWLAAQVDHVRWEGCTFWDLIQPAFTFMVGMAMPFALARRKAQGATDWQLFKHVAYRSFMLILLSNIYSNWGPVRPQLVLQLINVLSQIAFG